MNGLVNLIVFVMACCAAAMVAFALYLIFALLGQPTDDGTAIMLYMIIGAVGFWGVYRVVRG